MDDPFLGSDDPTLPSAARQSRRRDQRSDGKTLLFPNVDQVSHDDPALLSRTRGEQLAKYRDTKGVDSKGRPVSRFMRIKRVNPTTGEVIYSCLDGDSSNRASDSFFVVDLNGDVVVNSSGDPIVFSL